LQQISAWQIRGRLNIRSENESRTPTLFWEQDGEKFDINLSGTLGMGTITLKGDDNGLVMEQAGEPPYYAKSLSEVSVDWLGYEYPANYLLYWVRGLPAPDIPYTSSRNELGLMTSLNQGEWNIEYDRYVNTDAVFLPGRIVLNNARFRLTFVISGWELVQ
jgi:outer membrane lipoprotein LolB